MIRRTASSAASLLLEVELCPGMNNGATVVDGSGDVDVDSNTDGVVVVVVCSVFVVVNAMGLAMHRPHLCGHTAGIPSTKQLLMVNKQKDASVVSHGDTVGIVVF